MLSFFFQVIQTDPEPPEKKSILSAYVGHFFLRETQQIPEKKNIHNVQV